MFFDSKNFTILGKVIDVASYKELSSKLVSLILDFHKKVLLKKDILFETLSNGNLLCIEDMSQVSLEKINHIQVHK